MTQLDDMKTLRLTSKRQATFPKEACDSLGLKPGDRIELESRFENGTQVWVMRPQRKHERDWIGSLGKKARKVQDHSLEAIRKSIAKGRPSD